MTSIFEPNCGVHFFDNVNAAYLTLYTVLANNLMIGWKQPKSPSAGNEDDESDRDEEGKGSEKMDIEQVLWFDIYLMLSMDL
ncbi:Argonaute-binding protein [Aspergillus lentulus]|nr:Argonaute-binding protein [Aspergillus lentulus]